MSERYQDGLNGSNGNGHISNRTKVLGEALSSPSMRQVLRQEEVAMYEDSLGVLGVAEEDIVRNSEQLQEITLTRKQLETVYESKKGASAFRKGNGLKNGHH